MIGFTDSKYYEGIADKVREALGTTEEYSPEQLPGKVDEVYDKGKQAERKAFGNAYQQNGTRTDYMGAYAGPGWNDATFYPQFDIEPSGGTYAERMFRGCQVSNIKERLAECGVKLDTSRAKNMIQALQQTSTAEWPKIDLSLASEGTSYCFFSTAAHTIDEVIIGENTKLASTTFMDMRKLVYIKITGVINIGGIVFNSTTLAKVSITSIMTALSTETSGLDITFSKTAVDAAFETSPGAKDGSTSEEWLALVNSRPNWTISLA